MSTVATDTCDCRSPWKPEVLGVPGVKLTGGHGSPEWVLRSECRSSVGAVYDFNSLVISPAIRKV